MPVLFDEIFILVLQTNQLMIAILTIVLMEEHVRLWMENYYACEYYSQFCLGGGKFLFMWYTVHVPLTKGIIGCSKCINIYHSYLLCVADSSCKVSREYFLSRWSLWYQRWWWMTPPQPTLFSTVRVGGRNKIEMFECWLVILIR